MNDSIKTIAAMFLIRRHKAYKQKRYDEALAYANAYDLLCYAIEDRDDCISQFEGYEEAKNFLDNVKFENLFELETIYERR